MNKAPWSRWWQIAGSFHVVRRGYGWWRGRGQTLPAVATSPRFPGVDSRRLVADLRRDALATGLNLPSSEVAALRELAHSAPLQHERVGHGFTHGECPNGQLASGERVSMAYVSALRSFALVEALVHDPLLRTTARQYIGYEPEGIDARLWFSFVGDFDLETRRRMNQTVEYHHDVDHQHGNYFYVSFYLSDVDRDSGAHCMILGSHTDKPLRMKLGARRRTDAEILAHYGAARERVLEGPAGTGFIEDAACYHRALAPVTRERLMLQLRYF